MQSAVSLRPTDIKAASTSFKPRPAATAGVLPRTPTHLHRPSPAASTTPSLPRPAALRPEGVTAPSLQEDNFKSLKHASTQCLRLLPFPSSLQPRPPRPSCAFHSRPGRPSVLHAAPPTSADTAMSVSVSTSSSAPSTAGVDAASTSIAAKSPAAPPSGAGISAAGASPPPAPLPPASPQTPPPPPPPSGHDDDYAANYGHAVDVLQHDIPMMLIRSPDLSIYTPDVALVTPWATLLGLRAMYMMYRLLRWTARLLYSRTHVTLLRLWQTRSGVLRARWRACGTPRLTWPLGGGSRSAADIEVNYMEVIATYCFSSSGMIYEHRIDTVVPPEPPLLLWPVMMAARLFGGRQGMGEGRHVPIPEAANK